jgi:hypothetical protein
MAHWENESCKPSWWFRSKTKVMLSLRTKYFLNVPKQLANGSVIHGCTKNIWHKCASVRRNVGNKGSKVILECQKSWFERTLVVMSSLHNCYSARAAKKYVVLYFETMSSMLMKCHESFTEPSFGNISSGTPLLIFVLHKFASLKRSMLEVFLLLLKICLIRKYLGIFLHKRHNEWL